MNRRPTHGTETDRPLRILVVGAGVGGIAIARGLLRDGHDVAVFERRPDLQPGGGAVTVWPNGSTVLGQLGVQMDGAGQPLSAVRVVTATGRRVSNVDLSAIVDRLGGSVRMVPRRILLERLLDGFPADRIRCNARAVGVADARNGVRLEFDDGSSADGDLLIGADGLHSMVRGIVGAGRAEPTGWCSWQGLVTLPRVADNQVAQMIVGEHGNIGLWPAGRSELQWWFDLPWSTGFVRPGHPIDLLRSSFGGWSDLADRVLATLTDEDLASSPFPHFRHPIPRAGRGRITLLGDAAHTMPPTLAQGTNQALLDAMVLRKALSTESDLSRALRWYENTRRRKLKAVSYVTTLQVSRSETALRPAAMVSDGVMTWALTTFLRSVSHHRMSAEISRDFRAATTVRLVEAK